MKEKDRISPYTPTEYGKAREIDFVDERMVYLTESLIAKRLRQQKVVKSFQSQRVSNPFSEFFDAWCRLYIK